MNPSFPGPRSFSKKFAPFAGLDIVRVVVQMRGGILTRESLAAVTAAFACMILAPMVAIDRVNATIVTMTSFPKVGCIF